MTDLNEEQIDRYSRHILLPEVGGVGQQKLLDAKILVLGAGGLGSPAALYLAAAGVGTIGLVDSDQVELSNLQRQILHTTDDIGRPKVESAQEKLRALNPDLRIDRHNLRLAADNASELIAGYDVVVDGTDNFSTRFLVNDTCVLDDKPLVHAAILRFEGQLTTILPHTGPCYRCVFREPPPPGLVPSCGQAGIFGAVAGTVGALQATEALKLILGIGQPLVGRLLVYDALGATFRTVKVRRDPACPICGENPTITTLTDWAETCAASPGPEPEVAR